APRPAVPRPAAGPAGLQSGAGSAHDGDALQEPRWRLGALRRAQRHLGGECRADALPDALGRPAHGAAATEHRARGQHRHRARPWLVALAMVEATVVTNRPMATTALILGSCLLAIAATGSGCGGGTKVVAPPPPEVSISQPVEETVQETFEFTGRTSA